jgi:hypothetical protein
MMTANKKIDILILLFCISLIALTDNSDYCDSTKYPGSTILDPIFSPLITNPVQVPLSPTKVLLKT